MIALTAFFPSFRLQKDTEEVSIYRYFVTRSSLHFFTNKRNGLSSSSRQACSSSPHPPLRSHFTETSFLCEQGQSFSRRCGPSSVHGGILLLQPFLQSPPEKAAFPGRRQEPRPFAAALIHLAIATSSPFSHSSPPAENGPVLRLLPSFSRQAWRRMLRSSNRPPETADAPGSYRFSTTDLSSARLPPHRRALIR